MREGYNLKTLGPRAAQLIVELNERRQPIFSLADVTEITGLSPSSARSLVANTEARGIVTRLKPDRRVMQMALKDDLTDSVDGILGTAFQERDGKKIPTSADIARKR